MVIMDVSHKDAPEVALAEDDSVGPTPPPTANVFLTKD
jgi:hypothetical protein